MDILIPLSGEKNTLGFNLIYLTVVTYVFFQSCFSRIPLQVTRRHASLTYPRQPDVFCAKLKCPLNTPFSHH